MKVLGFAVLGLLMTAEAQAATCESLLALSLPHTTVTLAQPVAPGAFSFLPSRRRERNLPRPSNNCRRFAASPPRCCSSSLEQRERRVALVGLAELLVAVDLCYED